MFRIRKGLQKEFFLLTLQPLNIFSFCKHRYGHLLELSTFHL